MKSIFSILSFACLLLCSCDKSNPEYPDCIDQLIEQQRNEIKAVYKYNFLGKTVFDFNPAEECCDFPNVIYSEECNILCILNGIDGNQKCEGEVFYTKAVGKVLIWKK